jgi:hypothetical protein
MLKTDAEISVTFNDDNNHYKMMRPKEFITKLEANYSTHYQLEHVS